MIKEYAAALGGNPIDLSDLRKWFTSDLIQVAEIDVQPNGKVTALLARDFEKCSSGEEVQGAAWRLIGQMNGILFASDPDRSPVSVLGVYERTANGDWGRGAAYAVGKGGGRARGRAYSAVIGPDGLPVQAPTETPRQAAWLALASSAANPSRAADILIALRGEPDWFDLWKAEEIIHGFQDRFPWPADEVEWFRQTATLHRHSPWYRYNGKTAKERLDESGKLPMELGAARDLIARLAAAWLDWKATSG
jgi:hypothetical protein